MQSPIIETCLARGGLETLTNLLIFLAIGASWILLVT